MYTYQLEKPSDEIMSLFDDYFKKRAGDMKMYERKGICSMYVTARCEGELAGAMGIKKHKPKYYRYLHIVVDPDHRRIGIGNSIRYMAIKLLRDIGAETIDFIKEDNEFGHQRFKDLGFRMIGEIINKREPLYHYKQKIKNLKGLEEIWMYNITQD